jgi:hypothetical protein
MAYSFPVFRKGIVFDTNHLVSLDEARKIAAQIKKDYKLYSAAFRRALEHGNGASGFRTRTHETVQQDARETQILTFPSISFRLNDFSVQSRNSVAVCVRDHQSKIWTRLTCTRMRGKPATSLSTREVRDFFSSASRKADLILEALGETYYDHVKQVGVEVSEPAKYFFQLRAVNTSSDRSQLLLSELSHGLSLSKAFEDERFGRELTDYFAIVLGKKTSPREIQENIKAGKLDVFGYRSTKHDAIFTAKITKSQTDLCGYGYDVKGTLNDKGELSSNVFSHVATKDLLQEYAQHF